MKGDPRAALAILLCVLFYFAYSGYLNSKYGTSNPQQPTQEQSSSAPAHSTPSEESGSPESGSADKPESDTSSVVRVDPASLILESDALRLQFSQELGAPSAIVLKEFGETPAKDAPRVDLARSPWAFRSSPLGERVPTLLGVRRDQDHLVFEWQAGSWAVSESYELSGLYDGKVSVEVTNRGDRASDLTLNVELGQVLPSEPAKSSLLPGVPAQAVSWVLGSAGSHEQTRLDSLCTAQGEWSADTPRTAVEYFGIDHHYFLAAVLPQDKAMSYRVSGKAAADGSCRLRYEGQQVFGSVAPQETVRTTYRFFVGPKILSQLESVHPDLPDTLSLGWFDAIARPLLGALKWLERLMGNFGLAILVLTALLKVLFYPLMKQASVSMKKMAKLQPEMQKIRQSYQDDPRRQQQELMKFMAQNKVNPMKGCIPILPQIPVFLALFNVLMQSIELRHAPFVGWLQDLSAPDPYYVTPVILGGLMVLQQKLTPNPGMDPTQQKILMIMPVIFAVMFLSMPSGLVLYTLTNTVISIGQQQWLNRHQA